jgi:hypothetical protein
LGTRKCVRLAFLQPESPEIRRLAIFGILATSIVLLTDIFVSKIQERRICRGIGTGFDLKNRSNKNMSQGIFKYREGIKERSASVLASLQDAHHALHWRPGVALRLPPANGLNPFGLDANPYSR